MDSPVVQGVLALAAYLAAWLPTMALPLIEHPARAQLDWSSMDPDFYVWSLRWWPYAVSHLLNPLATTELGLPLGHALPWATTVPPLALLAAPLTAAAGPVVSFNLLTALALPVSAWAAFVMCRRFTGRFWPSVVGGAVYGFSAYEINHVGAGQLNLTVSLLLPLIVYLVLLWRDEVVSSRLFVGLLAVAMTLQFYLFIETFADMTAVWVIALAIGYVHAGRPGRAHVLRLARLVGLAYVFSIAAAAPYLADALTHVPRRFVHLAGVDLVSLVVPRPGHTFGLGWLAHLAGLPVNLSTAGYVGIPLVLIVIALAVRSWSNRTARFLTDLVIILVVAALGPYLYVGGSRIATLPWSKLWELPLVRSAFPARLMLFAYLVLALITALWLAGPASQRWARWARWPLAVLAIAAMVLDTGSLPLVRYSEVPPFVTAGEYRHVLVPGETVLVVSNVGNAGMLWQAETDFYFRLAGGFINGQITPHSDLPMAVAVLGHATPLDELRFATFIKRAGVEAILVQQSDAPAWASIFRVLGLHGQQVGGVTVYPTHLCRTCRVLGSPFAGVTVPAQLRRLLA